MACKLTYKGIRFNSKLQLLRHLQQEGILEQLFKNTTQTGDNRVQIQTQFERIDNKMNSFIKSNSIGLNITVGKDKFEDVKQEIDSCGLL